MKEIHHWGPFWNGICCPWLLPGSQEVTTAHPLGLPAPGPKQWVHSTVDWNLSNCELRQSFKWFVSGTCPDDEHTHIRLKLARPFSFNRLI